MTGAESELGAGGRVSAPRGRWHPSCAEAEPLLRGPTGTLTDFFPPLSQRTEDEFGVKVEGRRLNSGRHRGSFPQKQQVHGPERPKGVALPFSPLPFLILSVWEEPNLVKWAP